MVTKYVGEITLNGTTPVMPSDTKIPEKKEWNHFAIWNFNGKVWNPASAPAERNLNDIVKKLESQGYTGATKPGKIKKSTIRYAIKTTGVEDFTFTK